MQKTIRETPSAGFAAEDVDALSAALDETRRAFATYRLVIGISALSGLSRGSGTCTSSI